MLGIDITLLSLESIPSRDQNGCTLAIEFLDLQPVYITVNNKRSCVRSSSSSSDRKNPSISQANFGKGSFCILEGTEELLDQLKSPVYVKVSLLTKNDQLLLYEYGCGKIENLSLSSESSTENNSQPLNPGTNAVNEYEEIFQQKLKVFGKASIVAFCPSVQIDLVHSFGVSSSAGSATIAIAIIDLMKATSGRTIGATGRIIHDVTNDAEVRPIGIPFDVKGFLNQADRGVVPIPVPVPLLGDGIRNLAKRTPCETSFDFSVEGYLEASMDTTIALALRVQYQGRGQDELKDEDHGDSEYNSDDSVSIDDFFDKIHRKKALQESKLFLSESLDRNEESFEVQDPSTFHYKTVQRPKPKQKVITYGDRRKPVLVRYKAGRVPPRAVTQNGVPVSAARRVVKEWDSSPLNREVIVRKGGPVKPSKSKKQSSGLTAERERGKGKEKDRGESSVSVSDTSSIATSSSVSAPNAVDWQLRHAAERAVLTSRYTVVRPGAEAGGRAESGGESVEAPVPTAVPPAK
jgi:hypothetical protein